MRLLQAQRALWSAAWGSGGLLEGSVKAKASDASAFSSSPSFLSSSCGSGSALCVGVCVWELCRNAVAASRVVHIRRLTWTQSCAVPVLVLVLLAQQGLQCLLARQGLLFLLQRQQGLLAPVEGGKQRVESGPDYTVLV